MALHQISHFAMLAFLVNSITQYDRWDLLIAVASYEAASPHVHFVDSLSCSFTFFFTFFFYTWSQECMMKGASVANM